MSDPEEKLSQDEKKSALKNLEQIIDSMRQELDLKSEQFRIDDLGNLFGVRKSKTSKTIIEKLEQQKQLDKDIKQKFEQISEQMNQTEQKVKHLRNKYARL